MFEKNKFYNLPNINQYVFLFMQITNCIKMRLIQTEWMNEEMSEKKPESLSQSPPSDREETETNSRFPEENLLPTSLGSQTQLP